MQPIRTLAIVTDAWKPQVNGVVTTLVELVEGLKARGIEVEVIEPSTFRRIPCPGYREIELSILPYTQLARRLDALRPDAIHIATEGPLGGAARRYARRRGLAFTTAFHTRFPDILAKALRVPQRWGYAWFRRFHAPSSGVMVPAEGMLKILQQHGFAKLRRWSHGVDLELFKPVPGADLGLPRPVWLYVGRVSYEKNLEAFLELELPGSKLVYGVGPLEAALKKRYPQVHWRGVVAREHLPAIYSGADVFVFPSRSETFGLVMLEAMACGTPVAAYPEAGPLDVIGEHHDGRNGGVLHADLQAAARQALLVSRQAARERALGFDWAAVCDRFIAHLVPANVPASARLAARGADSSASSMPLR
ncbi:glycosyltransferase family 4 protein [Rivibacter subsaxonicus]|uniref:Glycosyltransferase involved in cell wall biosynthesis n=1 Tax=Rivibacter subsaxonicus TaxID=457575 RepID=A0A4Q7W1M9_9BURK|nr:glycosyltransferase family 1 protein [Rivibacter subsaxonicus]RZU02818.1 glycosyltransferase involved in cell wall biosynthesis [Rivibacter subsaxonicus]